MTDYRVLPVADLDRSRAFYGETLGWSVDFDQEVSADLHFIQVTSPGSACSIAFGRGISEMASGSLKALQVVVDDADAVLADLTARGVEAHGVEAHGVEDLAWGRFVRFADPDGNTWACQQLPARG